MIRTIGLTGQNGNGVRRTTEQLGNYSVIEYDHDISVSQAEAVQAYFAAQMNIRKRQLKIDLNNSGVVIQSGAMQWFGGSVDMVADVKGAGDLIGKMFSARVTGETAIKPKYQGTGILVLEPTYKHILLEDLSKWNGALVIEDGLFLACDSSVSMKVVARSNFSSAVAGGEGLFNNCLTGTGIVALESPVPRNELIEIELENDVVKIDGNFAIAWSNTLQFTVERSSKTLIGSAASGEGLVNVYRGTGRVLMAPVG